MLLKTFRYFNLSPEIWIFEWSQLVQILAKTKQPLVVDFTEQSEPWIIYYQNLSIPSPKGQLKLGSIFQRPHFLKADNVCAMKSDSLRSVIKLKLISSSRHASKSQKREYGMEKKISKRMFWRFNFKLKWHFNIDRLACNNGR